MCLLNSVRIAALILIGDANAATAVKGFHSVAGWLFFNLTACGLIWVSSRSGFFSKTKPAIAVDGNTAAPYLMPLIVIVATSMVSRALTDGFDILYPARVVTAGIVLWRYRDKLVSFLRSPPWWPFWPGCWFSASGSRLRRINLPAVPVCPQCPALRHRFG